MRAASGVESLAELGKALGMPKRPSRARRAHTPATPPATKATTFTPAQQRTYDAIVAKMWSWFCAEAVAQEQEDDTEMWPANWSEVVDELYAVLGLNNHDGDVATKVVKLFDLNRHETVHATLRLTASDRAKIREEVTDSCLSAEAKASIFEAIK